MFKCPACSFEHTDGVKCSSCTASYCFGCANITEKNYRKLSQVKKDILLCPSCKAPPAPVDQPLVQAAPSATLDLVLHELRDGIRGINVRLEQLPTLVQEIQDMKERFQHFEVSTNAKTAAFETRITALEAKDADSADYPQLQIKLTQLAADLASKEQRDRINNIEIKGVPIKKNENLVALVCKLADSVGQTVLPSDINFVTRARSAAASKPIIVGFLVRYTKENLLAAAKMHKNLTAEALGFTGVAHRIFFNDHLTRENKQLLTKVKKLATERNYKFTWVQNCKILTRKNDTSPIILIQQEDDLNKIK